MNSPEILATKRLDQILQEVINKAYKEAKELVETLRDLDHETTKDNQD